MAKSFQDRFNVIFIDFYKFKRVGFNTQKTRYIKVRKVEKT